MNAEAANRILPALMGALLLGLAAPAPAALSVKVAEATEVGAPQVTLGRIAELAGGSPALRRQAEGLVVHRFDGDSQRWRVSGRAVSRALWQADIPLKRVELDIPLGARVTWRMEPIDGQRVKQAITEQLRAGAGDGGRLSVAFPQGLPAFDGLPARGRVNVSREAADRVRVRVSVDGQVAASRSVPVRVARERRVVVAAKDLSAGTRLQPGDLERAYRPVSGSRWSHFRRSEEVAGSWVLRQVPAGQPVQRDHLRMQPDVRPGDPVTLVFEGEQLSISAPGKVRQQGAIGEVLAVENRQSGKAVYARLVDGSTAKVVDRKLSQRGGRP